ncbi:hypothetical protein EVAR_97362_1 [Eumeta japonica]|uniref:Uncharacterized protein n=1 Tax=Eumeta variegata TaxID=151549 RepID=A0A4C1YVK4_EUMVA|nr:hypothetical protein EVAR_97362_1 [Eumeta japonica]
MATRNSRGVTSALPTFRVGIGCVIEEEWADGWEAASSFTLASNFPFTHEIWRLASASLAEERAPVDVKPLGSAGHDAVVIVTHFGPCGFADEVQPAPPAAAHTSTRARAGCAGAEPGAAGDSLKLQLHDSRAWPAPRAPPRLAATLYLSLSLSDFRPRGTAARTLYTYHKYILEISPQFEEREDMLSI